MTYSEKLKDPRWQKRRLEIMSRDGFACTNCGASTETLSVHHFFYGRNPWDVKNEDLTTLCESCHDFIEGVIKKVRRHSCFGPHMASIQDLCTLLDGPQWYEISGILCLILNHPNLARPLYGAAMAYKTGSQWDVLKEPDAN